MIQYRSSLRSAAGKKKTSMYYIARAAVAVEAAVNARRLIAIIYSFLIFCFIIFRFDWLLLSVF